MKAIKLKDIAKKFNVSVSTVSKAIAGYSDIKRETSEKILEYVKKINFHPNSIASSLKTKRTKTIGIVIPDMQNLFFTKILNSIVNNAQREGYRSILMCSNESFENESDCIDELINNNVEAVFIALSDRTVEYSHLQRVKDSGIILIQFDKISKIIQSSTVTTNNIESAYELTERLIKFGRRKIAHLRGGYISQVSIDRFIGYQKALEKYNIKYDKNLVMISESRSFDEAISKIQDMIDKKIDFDSVLAIDDKTAMGAIKCLTDNKIKVPEQVAVVGFSNAAYSKYLSPSLSSMDQSAELFGSEIIKIFLKEKKNKKLGLSHNFSQIKIPTKFIKRESF
ncbi:MAG: hypothetical protein CMC57_02995 [Flavobacteriaceae bacterium]|nr:hypothetical protein [Flavobacteriaceae bacterium]